jgi:hypothetical protein
LPEILFFEGTGGAEPLLRFIEKKLGCERQLKNKQIGIQGGYRWRLVQETKKNGENTPN